MLAASNLWRNINNCLYQTKYGCYLALLTQVKISALWLHGRLKTLNDQKSDIFSKNYEIKEF